MALNEKQIAVVRGALKGHVQSSLEVVATLTEFAKTEKDPSNGVHAKLRQAQNKLAEQGASFEAVSARKIFLGPIRSHSGGK